jgi:hypothetical protein
MGKIWLTGGHTKKNTTDLVLLRAIIQKNDNKSETKHTDQILFNKTWPIRVKVIMESLIGAVGQKYPL